MFKYLLPIALLFCTTAIAQEKCGQNQYMQKALRDYPQYADNIKRIEEQTKDFAVQSPTSAKKTTAILTIPVVFHVLYNDPKDNINDFTLVEQIYELNKDFRKKSSGIKSLPVEWAPLVADCEIEFCLANKTSSGQSTTGITHTYTSSKSFNPGDNFEKDVVWGGVDIWDRDYYLNIWVCKLDNGVLGYAPIPGGPPAYDGVTLDTRAVGTTGANAGSDSGHTATHEIGHWLNLLHIWGDDTDCSGSDNVGDTPNQEKYSGSCATFPKYDACTSTYPGIMFTNFMDYSNDYCVSFFTNGQKTRMQAVINNATGVRRSLWSSGVGCNAMPPLSVTKILTEKTVQVYPNPAQDILYIQTDYVAQNVKITLQNVLGQVIPLNANYNQQNGSYAIDVKGIETGIYLLNISNSSSMMTKKIAIQ